MKVYLDDVIAAISTPLGQGGIGIVRVSGKGAIELVDQLFVSAANKRLVTAASHTICYGRIVYPQKKEVLDEVLVTVMRAPHTYTKEDIVEINCHGGMLITQDILQLCLNYGARLAQAGEFTKRAFLNGRIDLTQAEAVMDMIGSKTELSRQTAVNQLEGKLKKKIKQLREKVLDMVASIEAAIDYPEHDIEEETYGQMAEGCNILLDEIQILLNTAEEGKLIRQGIQTVILGKPNVGKSSLLNTLLEEERAIVTDIPGTTRDIVEESLNIGGILIKIVDTAGIRLTEDIVEKIGVEKSKSYAQKADLILLMLDASQPLTEEDKQILEFAKDKKSILLFNKMDKTQVIDIQQVTEQIGHHNYVMLSLKEKTGLTQLTEKIKDLFFHGQVQLSDAVIINNARQQNALVMAKEALKQALETIHNKMPEDFISMDLQDVLRALGEITGDTVDDEIIDRIFTKFCLGK